MPQLDITTFSSQIFWLGVCFLSLALFSSIVTLPRLRRILEHRTDRISGTLAHSEELQKQAEQLLKEYEEKLTRARKQAHEDLLKNSRQQTLTYSEERFRISSEIKKKLQKSESLLSQEQRSSRKEIDQETRQVATRVIEHFMRGNSHA